MTVKGGTSAACSACKYQRRRCLPTCPLAPYFPHDQPKLFLYVHRVFGVKNVTKTLKKLPTKDLRDDAMKSMIFEAEMRERYPVHGCSVIIFQLRNQLNYALEELKFVYEQLAKYREQQQVDNQFGESNSIQQELKQYSSEKNLMEMFHENQYINEVHHQSFLNEYNWFSEEPVDDMSKSFHGLELIDGVSNDNNIVDGSIGTKDKGKGKLNQEYENMGFNVADNYKQYAAYSEGMEANESWCTAESSQKGSGTSLLSPQTEVCDSELKNAAADFSLTTISSRLNNSLL